eukprot:357583-Prymnesium_polylepis.1
MQWATRTLSPGGSTKKQEVQLRKSHGPNGSIAVSIVENGAVSISNCSLIDGHSWRLSAS